MSEKIDTKQPAATLDSTALRIETRSKAQVETRVTTVEIHPIGSLAPMVRVTVDMAIALNPSFRESIKEEQDHMTERIRELFPI